MNNIEVLGNLGGDAEERCTSDGQKIVSFNIASNYRRGGKTETTWFRVTIFGDRFQKMVPYLKKGSSLIVIGELRLREYTDRDGNPRTSAEVIADRIAFSPFGRGERTEQQQQQQQGTFAAAGAAPAAGAATASQMTGASAPTIDAGFGQGSSLSNPAPSFGSGPATGEGESAFGQGEATVPGGDVTKDDLPF